MKKMQSERNRRWRRDKNRTKANRKYHIYVRNFNGGDYEDVRRPKHYFVKGKCHCSCTACSRHTNAKHSRKQTYYGMWSGGTMNWKHGEALQWDKTEQKLNEFFEKEELFYCKKRKPRPRASL